jgi:hypothetical protein
MSILSNCGVHPTCEDQGNDGVPKRSRKRVEIGAALAGKIEPPADKRACAR